MVPDKAKMIVNTWPNAGSSSRLGRPIAQSGYAGGHVVCSLAVFSSDLGQKVVEKQKEDCPGLDSLEDGDLPLGIPSSGSGTN